MISMEDWITIRNLKKRNPNMGTKAIAKKLGLSRNTVKKALRSEDPPAYKRKAYINPELVSCQPYNVYEYAINTPYNPSFPLKNQNPSQIATYLQNLGYLLVVLFFI